MMELRKLTFWLVKMLHDRVTKALKVVNYSRIEKSIIFVCWSLFMSFKFNFFDDESPILADVGVEGHKMVNDPIQNNITLPPLRQYKQHSIRPREKVDLGDVKIISSTEHNVCYRLNTK